MINTFNDQDSKLSYSIAWHLQWVKAGEQPSHQIQPGKISGFSDYFSDIPDDWDEFYICISGNERFKVADWMRKKALELGMTQYITEVKIKLKRTFTERIQAINLDATKADEFELTKSVTKMKKKLAVAWSKSVMDNENFTIDDRLKLLTAATSNDLTAFLPISAKLFNQTILNMRDEFVNAKAILFPALPIWHNEWLNKPIKLVAFRKSVVITAKAVWSNNDVEFV